MTVPITPPTFVDLMTMCLAWEWDQAMDRFVDSLQEDKTIWPTHTGFTTVDKIVRILHGLKILSAKQKGALYKDRRTQSLVLRNSYVNTPGINFQPQQRETNRRFLLICDIAAEINRQKMLRNMRFYITAYGEGLLPELEQKWGHMLTKEQYFTEIRRQEEHVPRSKGGRSAMMARYNRRVNDET